MKTSIKFLLLGIFVGVVVMVIVGLFIVFSPRPSLDKQVVKQLGKCGYHVTPLDNNMYEIITTHDNKIIFDHFPDDNAYLRFWGTFVCDEYAKEEVAAACVEVMRAKKNIILYPQEDENGMYVWIEASSFVDEDVMIDKKIVESSIDVIEVAAGMLYHELQHPEESD